MRIYIFFTFLLLSMLGLNFLSAEKFTLVSVDNFESTESINFQSTLGRQNLYISEDYVNVPHRIPESKLIHFYSIDSETGKSSPEPTLRIEFDTTNETILLLKHDETQPKAMHYEFLENSIDAFPYRSLLIYNLSDQNIVGSVDNELIKVPTNSRQIVQLSKNENGTFNGAVEFFGQDKNKRIVKLMSSFWRITSNNKVLVVIDKCEESDQPKVHKLLLKKVNY